MKEKDRFQRFLDAGNRYLDYLIALLLVIYIVKLLTQG